MIKAYCKTCKNKHFNNWQCSQCGIDFSSIFPSISTDGKIYYKYCPNCGHKFNLPNEIARLNDEVKDEIKKENL